MNGTAAPPIDLLQAVRVSGLFTALLVIAATWFVTRITFGAAQQLGTRFSEHRPLLNQIAALLRFGIWLGGLTLATALSVRLSRETLLALGGTAAVAIGFALKDLAASLLAGVIILIDRPFRLGDRVTYAGTYGEVVSIGLRSVRLVTLDDTVVTIPNNKFLTDVVNSANAGALEMMVQLDFHIGVDQDVLLARRLVAESLTSCRHISTERTWRVVVQEVFLAPVAAVRIRAKGYVMDVQFEEEFVTDANLRVRAAFQAHGVLPPAVLHRPSPD